MTIHATIHGRLSRDGELKYAQDGKAMLRLSVPSQERRFNKETNQWEDASATTWVSITIFGQQAEDLADMAIKGAPITAMGNLATREYTSQQGEQRSQIELRFPKVTIGKAVQRQQGQGGGFAQPQGAGALNQAANTWGQQPPNQWATQQPQQQPQQGQNMWDAEANTAPPF